MSQLTTIIKNEYMMDIRSKSFWISTLLIPVGILAFMLFADKMYGTGNNMALETQVSACYARETALKTLGLMTGLFLMVFLMFYGASIFNKVRFEKTNRIVEVISTCVDGRTMMLAKILSVGATGLTQISVCGLMSAILLAFYSPLEADNMPWHTLGAGEMLISLVWALGFFIGGYVFYGSMFAAVGAMSDKNNENQIYVTILTMVILGSFYTGMYALEYGTDNLVRVLSLIPFTSPDIAAVNAVTGSVPPMFSLMSLAILYAGAGMSLAISGKIYRCSILLKGKRITPSDILFFLRLK